MVELDQTWDIDPNASRPPLHARGGRAARSTPAGDLLLSNADRHVGQRNLEILAGPADAKELIAMLGGLVPDGFTLELTHAGRAALPALLALTGGRLEGREEVFVPDSKELRVGVPHEDGRHLLTVFRVRDTSVLGPDPAAGRVRRRAPARPPRRRTPTAGQARPRALGPRRRDHEGLSGQGASRAVAALVDGSSDDLRGRPRPAARRRPKAPCTRSASRSPTRPACSSAATPWWWADRRRLGLAGGSLAANHLVCRVQPAVVASRAGVAVLVVHGHPGVLEIQGVDALATGEGVVAAVATQPVVLGGAGQPVVAGAATQHVGAVAAVQDVGAVAAAEQVAAAQTAQGVVAAEPADHVGARGPLDHVVAGRPGDRAAGPRPEQEAQAG